MESPLGRYRDFPSSPRSPIEVFGLVLLIVFAAEGAIMLVLPRLPRAWRGTLLDGLLDAGTLTLVVAPAVWFLVVRPLRWSFTTRGRLLRRLFESQEQERARIARDLHDSVGQNLTALMVGLRMVEGTADLEAAHARAAELREFAAVAHAEVRRLARGLRPLILEDLGLEAALRRLCEDFQSNHTTPVTLVCEPASAARLDAQTETALYRILQEALTNVARHAQAMHVEVRLMQDDRSTVVKIGDDGQGFATHDAAASGQRLDGFGLGGIRERALILGGECRVHTRRGRGTTIEVRIPRRRRP